MSLAIEKFNNSSKEGLSLSYTKDDLNILKSKDEELGSIKDELLLYEHYEKVFNQLKQRYFKNV